MSNQYFFRINGLNDNESVDQLEQVLKSIEGVEFVEVDLETGMASVRSSATSEKLTAIIDQAGYNAVLVSD